MHVEEGEAGNEANVATPCSYSPTHQVVIPVSGRRSAGVLRSTSVFRDGQWQLTNLVLEFRGRTEKLVVLDKCGISTTNQ